MRETGQKIKSFDEWKIEMLRLAEQAESENRLMNAAFYCRAAEFYLLHGDPEKEILYDRFIDLFYKSFESDEIERYNIPFQESFLPAMRVPAKSGKTQGIIIMHGGFDSFIEEFYSWMLFFSQRGYEVIGFDGPGQGGAHRKYGLALDYEWEKPAKAVLDYFKFSDVTWLGISMGGWFCFRAAAFEPRIKKVIASGIAFDYMKIPNIVGRIMGGVVSTSSEEFYR